MRLVFIASSCTETTRQNIVRHDPEPNRGHMSYISDNSQYAAPGRRLALVIGNGAYNVMPDFFTKIKKSGQRCGGYYQSVTRHLYRFHALRGNV